MTRGAEYLIGLPKILELPDIKIDRNNRMVLESGALKIIRKVRPGMYLYPLFNLPLNTFFG